VLQVEGRIFFWGGGFAVFPDCFNGALFSRSVLDSCEKLSVFLDRQDIVGNVFSLAF